MILDGFKKFTETGRSFMPKISIRTNGQVGFNTGAVKRFAIDKYLFVVAYYNEMEKKIAVQFINEGDAEGAMRIVKNANNYFFSGKSFLDFHNIDYSKTVARSVEWIKEEAIAIIDLDKDQVESLEQEDNEFKDI